MAGPATPPHLYNSDTCSTRHVHCAWVLLGMPGLGG